MHGIKLFKGFVLKVWPNEMQCGSFISAQRQRIISHFE